MVASMFGIGIGIGLVLALGLVQLEPSMAVLSPDDCQQSVGIEKLPFLASSLKCTRIWDSRDFILRYSLDKSSNILSILLSASIISTWMAMGFSPDGNMISSSAVVGFFEINGTGILRQYYLQGKQPGLVIPNQGNLSLIGETAVHLQNQTLYMAFQVDINSSPGFTEKVVFAYGVNGILPDPTNYEIQMHQGYYQVTFDFATGSSSRSSSKIDKFRSNHGIVNIFGWAVIAPIGAMIPRYFRQYDPTWLYAHIGFQCSGFLFAIAGFVMGLQLVKQIPGASVHYHRALGTCILVMAILQVLALVIRPRQKSSKIRKYWNWYHLTIGRVVLFLAAINIIVGMKIGKAGLSMRIAYFSIVGFIIICVVLLELLLWSKRYKQTPKNRPPSSFPEPIQSPYNNL